DYLGMIDDDRRSVGALSRSAVDDHGIARVDLGRRANWRIPPNCQMGAPRWDGMCPRLDVARRKQVARMHRPGYMQADYAIDVAGSKRVAGHVFRNSNPDGRDVSSLNGGTHRQVASYLENFLLGRYDLIQHDEHANGREHAQAA